MIDDKDLVDIKRIYDNGELIKKVKELAELEKREENMEQSLENLEIKLDKQKNFAFLDEKYLLAYEDLEETKIKLVRLLLKLQVEIGKKRIDIITSFPKEISDKRIEEIFRILNRTEPFTRKLIYNEMGLKMINIKGIKKLSEKINNFEFTKIVNEICYLKEIEDIIERNLEKDFNYNGSVSNKTQKLLDIKNSLKAEILLKVLYIPRIGLSEKEEKEVGNILFFEKETIENKYIEKIRK